MVRVVSYYWFVVISFIFITGCIYKESEHTNETLLIQKIDSLREELKILKEIKTDSSSRIDFVAQLPIKKESEKVSPASPVIKTTPIKKDSVAFKKTTRPAETPFKPDTSTIIHYYKNSKKPSVKITPWIDGRRFVLLFDITGNETYRFDDVRMSYSSTSTIKSFHENGAVKHIQNHMNPGASMYWYESDIYFDTNNEPTERNDIRQPARLEDYMYGKSVWDKETRSWKKLYVPQNPIEY